MNNKPTIAFHTLGCKLNYAETTALEQLAIAEGYEKRSFEEAADIYVLNTCSVTENADKECRYWVRRIQRLSPGSFVAVMGCYAQLKPKEIAEIDGVHLVLGASEKFNLPHHLKSLIKGMETKVMACEIDSVTQFHPSHSIGDRARAFLKVQDGCDYTCSFCTIPMARGRSRSPKIQEIADQAFDLVQKGVKEIVLTGVNIGDFGKGEGDNIQHKRQENFLQLLEALDCAGGAERYRISSIEPNLLSEPIIHFVGQSESFMPHFHIPLQSGSNKTLAAMRRRYRRELYAEKVAEIRKAIPDCCIGADVIVGFPGETDADFSETYDFIKGLDISYLHVFTYSERNNTTAIDIQPVVPIHIRNVRNKMLRSLSLEKQGVFEKRFAGTVRKVLFENNHKNGIIEGYTDNYIRVSTLFREGLQNSIIDWKL